MSALKFLTCDSASWHDAWARLELHYGGLACKHTCPDTGERWQYMGSVVDGSSVRHQFRHRSLNGERVVFETDPLPFTLADYYAPHSPGGDL